MLPPDVKKKKRIRKGSRADREGDTESVQTRPGGTDLAVVASEVGMR